MNPFLSFPSIPENSLGNRKICPLYKIYLYMMYTFKRNTYEYVLHTCVYVLFHAFERNAKSLFVQDKLIMRSKF